MQYLQVVGIVELDLLQWGERGMRRGDLAGRQLSPVGGRGGTMTNQEKIRFLRRYREAEGITRDLEDQLAELRTRAAKITPAWGDVPAGGGSDRLQSAVVKLVELEGRIGDHIQEQLSIRQQVVDTIQQVQEPKLRRLLWLRYISGYTWERVAVEMHYSYMQVCRLHGAALNQIVL